MTRTRRRTKTLKQKIFDKKLKTHMIAHKIALTKNELEKRKLRKQLNRQYNTLKMLNLQGGGMNEQRQKSQRG